ncbi:MAG: CNNM domain-containing protein [Sphingomonadales bacterium]
MTLLIVYLLIALVFSFFCSIAEATLLSLRPAYIRVLAGRKPAAAKMLGALKDDLDRPLAAILTLNTVAHTVGAAGVGAQAATVYGDQYLGLISAILTLLILFLSEIIPKSLGALYWQSLAAPLAPLIAGLTRLLAPFIWLTRQVTRLMAPKGKSASLFSRAELEAMAAAGVEEGHLDAKQLQMVGNILRLRDVSVRQIMTPRGVIFACPEEMTVEGYFTAHRDQPFSRVPVYHERVDDITGFVLKRDILKAQAEGRSATPLAEMRREFVAIPDFQSVFDVFDTMLRENLHVALIVDEYGAVQGLVSLEDVIETLIGLEIVDETDAVADMQALAREKWLARRRQLEAQSRRR